MDEELEQPVSNDDSSFFDEVDKEVIEETNSTDEVEETPTETESEESKELDYTPFLKDLGGKVKYNKENVEIGSIDDVVTNYQKGLNYDKLQDKLNTLENSKGMTYLKNKADEFGMTFDEYIQSIEKQEEQNRKANDEKRLEEMIENGVPEEIAKEVIATSELRRQVQLEKNQIEKEKKERQAKEDKDKDYKEFLKAFPDVKPEDIPKEVFEKSTEEGYNLRSAYLEYQNAELKRQLEISKNNEKNRNTAVGSATEFGSVQEKSDPFLEGFDSD